MINPFFEAFNLRVVEVKDLVFGHNTTVIVSINLDPYLMAFHNLMAGNVGLSH
jgi:hypothetical protein